jgi:hypothetical protein
MIAIQTNIHFVAVGYKMVAVLSYTHLMKANMGCSLNLMAASMLSNEVNCGYYSWAIQFEDGMNLSQYGIH